MRIDLLGTSFTIQSDEDPAYVRNLVGYYRDKLTEVRESVSTNDDLKIAILGALTVVDELFKERHRNQNSSSPVTSGEDDLQIITQRLIETIDSALEDDNPASDV